MKVTTLRLLLDAEIGIICTMLLIRKIILLVRGVRTNVTVFFEEMYE